MFALWQLLFDVSPANKRLETEWNKKGPMLVIPISLLCGCLGPLCADRWCAKSHFHLQDNKQAALCDEHWAKLGIFGKTLLWVLKKRDKDKTINTSEKSQSKISIFRSH